MYKVGDEVFVIDWGAIYSDFYSWENSKRELVFPWETEIPDYTDQSFHWKFEYEPNLNVDGSVSKRRPTKVKSKYPAFRDYKYEIREMINHPKAGEYTQTKEVRKAWPSFAEDRYPTDPILLLSSTNSDIESLKCFVQIGIEGVSLLTPEQYENKKFNALVESHLGKWHPDMDSGKLSTFPEELRGRVYDPDDNVLFGSSMVKGLITYEYIPKQFTRDGIEFLIASSCSYDGKGNSQLPPDAEYCSFFNLKKRFPKNKFK